MPYVLWVRDCCVGAGGAFPDRGVLNSQRDACFERSVAAGPVSRIMRRPNSQVLAFSAVTSYKLRFSGLAKFYSVYPVF